MSHRSDRPVALVTGAGRRVGAVIARRLHAANYAVALHYRGGPDEASELASDLNRQRPGSAMLIHAELAAIDRLPLLVQAVLDEYGRLDALINNASAFYPSPIDSASLEQWQELFASNAQAPFFLIQAALPALRESHGAIVNMVDIYAERALAGHPLYVMAKAALAAMTRTLAIDLAPQVRINGVAPGAILWPDEGKSQEQRQVIVQSTPLQRIGTPAEIADTVLWLLRDAHFITGQILAVDGGRSLPV